MQQQLDQRRSLMLPAVYGPNQIQGGDRQDQGCDRSDNPAAIEQGQRLSPQQRYPSGYRQKPRTDQFYSGQYWAKPGQMALVKGI